MPKNPKKSLKSALPKKKVATKKTASKKVAKKRETIAQVRADRDLYKEKFELQLSQINQMGEKANAVNEGVRVIITQRDYYFDLANYYKDILRLREQGILGRRHD